MQGIESPFQFLTASYLVRIQDLKATTLAEFAGALEACSDASIFFHTFQSLSRHHFLTKGFSNDFANGGLAACNRPELARSLPASTFVSTPRGPSCAPTCAARSKITANTTRNLPPNNLLKPSRSARP